MGLNRVSSIAAQLVSLVYGAPGTVPVSVDQTTPLPVTKGHQLTPDCVIANGASLSAAVDLGAYRLCGIVIPASFEPTTLTFQASHDGTNWFNVYDSGGTEKSVTVAASRRVILSPADFYGLRHIKVRGGTASSPSTVSADRTLKLIAEG